MKARKKAAKASKKAAKKSRMAAEAGASAADQAAAVARRAKEAEALAAAKLRYVGKKVEKAGTDKRKLSQFSANKIAAETEANLKKMKSASTYSSLFAKNVKGVNEGTLSASDLFTRANGAVGNRM